MKRVLKFSASWCQPCKMLSRVIEDAHLSVPVTEIDIDEEFEIAQAYQIRGVPTLVVLEDEKEVKRKSGMMMENELREFLE